MRLLFGGEGQLDLIADANRYVGYYQAALHWHASNGRKSVGR